MVLDRPSLYVIPGRAGEPNNDTVSIKGINSKRKPRKYLHNK
jgi:hypothetical protein